MNFNGRWVRMEVMDAIILLWTIAVILVAFVLFRVMRAAPPKKTYFVKQKSAPRKRNGKQK